MSEKWAILRLPLNVQKPKLFHLQGASPPWPPIRSSAHGPRWGLRPQTFVIGSRSARSPCPPLPNPKYATGHPRYEACQACIVSLRRGAFTRVGWQLTLIPYGRWRKNLADTSYKSRVIANFVPNFVAMATGGRSEDNAICSIRWPITENLPISAKISQKSPTQADL